MRESDLRKLIRQKLPMVHWQAVETGGTGLGVPDLNGCYEGVEFWVELKLVKRGLKLGLSPTQIAWLARRHRVGGRAWVFARRLDMFKLWSAELIDTVSELGWAAPCDGCWNIGRMEWTSLLSRLVGAR